MLLLLLFLFTFGTVELADTGKVYVIKNNPFLRLIKISKEMADLLAERQKRQYLVYRQDSGIQSGPGLDVVTPGIETTANQPISAITKSLREQLEGLESSAQYIVMPSNSVTLNPNLLNSDKPENLKTNVFNLDTNTVNSINFGNTLYINFTSKTDSPALNTNILPLTLNEFTTNTNGLTLNPTTANPSLDINRGLLNSVNLNLATERSFVSPRDIDIGTFFVTTDGAITLQAYVPVDNPVDIAGPVAIESPWAPVTPMPYPSIEAPIQPIPPISVPPPIDSPISLLPNMEFPSAAPINIEPPTAPFVAPMVTNAAEPQVVIPRFDSPTQPAINIPQPEAPAPMVPFVPPPVLTATPSQSQFQPQFGAIMPAIEVMPTVESIALVALPRCQLSVGNQGSCPGIHADVTPNVAGLISLAAYSALPTLQTPVAGAVPQTNSQFTIPAPPLPEQSLQQGPVSSCGSSSPSCGSGVSSAEAPIPPPSVTINVQTPVVPPSGASPKNEASFKSTTKGAKTTKPAPKANEVTTPSVPVNGSIDSMLEAIKLEIGQIKNGRFGGCKEGLPCPLQGSWESDSAGVIFTLTKPEDIEFTVPVTPWPEKHGFFSSPNWEVSAFVPFPKQSFFMMTAVHPGDLRMATFSGECRVCNGKEFIVGHWLLVRGQSKCEDLNRAQDFFGDLWKRKCPKKT